MEYKDCGSSKIMIIFVLLNCSMIIPHFTSSKKKYSSLWYFICHSIVQFSSDNLVTYTITFTILLQLPHSPLLHRMKTFTHTQSRVKRRLTERRPSRVHPSLSLKTRQTHISLVRVWKTSYNSRRKRFLQQYNNNDKQQLPSPSLLHNTLVAAVCCNNSTCKLFVYITSVYRCICQH